MAHQIVGSGKPRRFAEEFTIESANVPIKETTALLFQENLGNKYKLHKRTILISSALISLIGYIIYLIFSIIHDFYHSLTLVVITAFVCLVLLYATLKETKFGGLISLSLSVISEFGTVHWNYIKW
mgnify:CR=1 FL=1